MREDVINTLEVFRYACIHQSQNVIWDREAVKRIEQTLLSHPKLERLHALIYQNASARKQLDWFNLSTQGLLKKTTYATIADIAAKRLFIGKLIPLLAASEIPIILLKGMAFNDDLYPAFGPRGTSDIDILVKPEDIEKFDILLAELARPAAADNGHPFDGLYEKSWIAKESANQFIDVHTHLTNPILFKIDSNALWATSYKHPAYLSENIRLMNDENTCAYLLTHMINDTNFYHYNLIDMHELVAKGKLQNLTIEKIVSEWGVSKAFSYVQQIGEKHLLTDFNLGAESSNHKTLFASLNWFFIQHVMLISASDKSVLQRIKQLVTYFLFVDNTKNVLQLVKKYLSIRFS